MFVLISTTEFQKFPYHRVPLLQAEWRTYDDVINMGKADHKPTFLWVLAPIRGDFEDGLCH